MAIGGSAQVALSSRNTLIRKRLHKQLAARRMLLEALEGRQLMAVGPQLLGIQPNEGALLTEGQVRKTAPNELVFRFDDRVGLDPTSLNGIRIIRSGDDGEFERASMATDLGSGGQSLVEFYAADPGQVGNGIQISFTQVSRTDTRAPVVRVTGRNVSVEVNSNPLLETRVDDLVKAFDQTISTNTVTNLVYALRLRGSTTLPIGRTVNTAAPVVLNGANAAKITTDFGTGANLQVRLNAKESGVAGVGTRVVVTTRDFGGPASPTVNVTTDATTGKPIIAVELNSNTRFTSTVSDFIAALNGNAQSSALIEATLISGSGSSRLGSLQVTYSPLVLTGVTDIEIVPGYVGLGDTNREVVMRFSEALPDDRYRVEILGRGSRVLKNLNGVAYNDGIDTAVSFELDLGAQIQSIVPQPVERQVDGSLKPNYNVIDVYFNNDDLINPGTLRSVNGLTIEQLRIQRPALFFQNSDIIINQQGVQITPDALNPQFYQLFHLASTLSNTDDTRFLPTAVRYYPEADRVTLTFSRELGSLVDPVGGAALPITELRLRIGTNDPKPLAPVSYAPGGDPADTFANAENLTGVWTPATGSKSIQINSAIQNTSPFLLDFPGGSNEIGGRFNRMQDHFRRNQLTGALISADSVDGITEIPYNFQSQLGVLNGTVLLNSITDQQKQRAREIFSLYERYLGVRFIETDTRGLTIAVGDLRSIVPFPETSLTTNPGVPSLNAPGGEILESGTLINSGGGSLATVLDSQDFSSSVNNEFGGAFSRAVAQGIGTLLGLGATDDLEGFTTQAFNSVLAPGVGTEIVIPGDAEIIHGQYLYRPDSKDVDLYQFQLPSSGRVSIETFAERMSSTSQLDTQIRLYQQLANGSWEEIAANDDYYSSDSYIELELGPGNYIIGVSASGNSQYDPSIADSGLGGRSQGKYDLRMDFRPPADKILKDATGTPIDGDADGTPGGVFDYWFRPSTAANTKYVDKRATTTGNGQITTPFKFIKDALLAAQPGDVVRIVGNGGADNKLSTVADNLAYEIGFNALGAALPDGTTLDVPKDVSVLIDAGAILKMRRSRVGVGSTSASVDRSAGTLAVLGTPVLVDSTGAVLKDAAGIPVEGTVYFTSVSDASLGINSSPAVNGTRPTAGDWGGIDFRNRVDGQDEQRKNFENRGQFLNWISHASLRYGGGQVVIDGVSQVVTPVQMVDSRPTVVYSSISSSADAAMSATPNSFKESNFHSPDEQRSGAFAADYTRIGPEIHGNQIIGNTLNGLQVRVRTGSTVDSMTVAGRMDDIDIVHIIPENLVIAGTPGGMLSDTVSPPATLVTLTAQSGGSLTAGVYSYRLTYVDANGNESGASAASQSLTVGANSSILLQNLPAVRTGSQYVGRRLYRSDATGSSNYVLVRELNASSTSIVDTGTTLGSPLLPQTESTRARLDGRLAIDGGTIVKLLGSRIEVQFGAQLIAEGTEDRAVVFTSTNDIRYGAGGTFTTSATGQAAGKGNWGGIYLSPTSKASLDHAVIAFGGGTTRIEGGFAEFDALEAHQADLRLANSRVEQNAAGNINNSTSDRGGRGPNSDAAVFVRGAQPVLVGNTLIDNNGAAFSINVSALNNTYVVDQGRSTGGLQRVVDRLDNQGPLVAENRLDKNAINGMVVRGGILTSEGVWDDTDVVHVVRNDIEVPNFHTFGGLRLQSSASQSLVVKMLGAGITADGRLIDNADRIGGAVQLIGTPGNPVLMTSARDASIGVGFTPDGRPQTDTLNSGTQTSTAATPGDWRSVRIGANSNDRNLAVVTELEPASSSSPNANATPDSAEYLGELASSLSTSDEVRRLGFQVKGTLTKSSDLDVYSFRATAGTEVWFDIDRTQNSLDTVVELVDANGRILALSNDSLAEETNPSLLYASNDMPGQSVHSLRKSTPELYLSSATGAPKDLYSTNPRDAGMRLVLPGEPGSATLYHVRIRSSNLRTGDAAARLIDPNFLTAGLTKGAYQMQIRLRELDEVPGSSVTYADMRYATNAIEVLGTRHSPLLGETAESNSANDTILNAQSIGNLLVTDKQAISIAGSLSNFSDVDWYSFSIDYTAIRTSELRRYFSTVFDMDYADGVGRPDTSIYVFNANNQLILGGLSSNLVDDQATGLSGAGGISDTSRGSAGALDPFVGAVELPVGQYFLAVTSSEMIPRALTAYINGGNTTLRLQPTNGVQLIAEDHVGPFSQGGSTAVNPVVPVLFPTVDQTFNSIDPGLELDLSEVPLFVSTRPNSFNNPNSAAFANDNQTNLFIVNGLTGEVSNVVGGFGQSVMDIAFRTNGELQAFDISPQPVGAAIDQDGLIDYLQIDSVAGGTGITVTDEGDLGIQTFHSNGTAAVDSDDGMYPSAMTFTNINGQERGFIFGSRGQPFPRDEGIPNTPTNFRPLVAYRSNILYTFDPGTGAASSRANGNKAFPNGAVAGAGTVIREYGFIDTAASAATARRGLIALNATDIQPNGSTRRTIVDGQQFTILDSTGFLNTFEFDSGPEIRINYDPVTGPAITDGLRFSLDGVIYEFDVAGGTPGVGAGAISIPLVANSSLQQLVDAISKGVGNGVTVSSEGNRMAFSGALVGDFTQLQARGIVTDLGVTGNISPLAIKVPFLVTDNANDIAARVSIAINASGVPGLNASVSGPQVSLIGGTVQRSDVLPVAGAPGGIISGSAVIDGVMYAVSDAGGLYRVNANLLQPGGAPSPGNIGTYVSTSFDLLGITFAGLTAAPDDVLNGALRGMLIGIDTQGVLYAFNTAGQLQKIFKGGASSVSTGLSNATGLAFSTLDNNLWHVSNARATDPGHGLPVTPDGSRTTGIFGGSSLFFGTEAQNPANRNYNFPGGAAGAIESQPFDLSGVSAGSLPTLYFNYFLATEGASAVSSQFNQFMRDSLRVYISGEDGEWVLAATNNSGTGPFANDDEFDPLVSGNSEPVQELFDNTSQWRQARVPLDHFAGQSNVRLRIEFSSAGGFGFGTQGGKGPQLRMKSGDRLIDGQTVTVGSQTFEIKTGPVLGLPAGASLTPGETVIIEGVNYVFTDGSVAVASPNIAVNYDRTMSAAQIAGVLLTAIQSAPRVKATINLTSTEQNDTLATALRGPTSGDSSIVTLSGLIGDNAALADPTEDIDLVRVELARGTILDARVNAALIGSPLDSYLRLFNSQGVELAANDNDIFSSSTDSRLTFLVPADGTYYIGVSGAGNSTYRPAVFRTATGGVSGSYQLVLDITRQLSPIVKGERLQLEGAAQVSVSPGSPIIASGSIATSGANVPVYVNLGMTAAQVGQALQAALGSAFADGNTLPFTLRGDTLDLTGFSANQVTAGPFGITTSLPGDQFSAFNASNVQNGPGLLRSLNNGFEGVHLDDFIIGLAGRGEMAVEAPADTVFVPVNPTPATDKILQGPYQLEVRGASEYGVPLQVNTPNSTLDLVNAISPLQRLSEGVSLRFNDASGLVAGTTFTISDGTRSVTVELDDVNDAIAPRPGNVPLTFSNRVTTASGIRSETAIDIATRFTDLINSSIVQSVLDVNAILVNGTSPSGSSVVTFTGQANVSVPTSVATTIVSKGTGDRNRDREQGQVVVQGVKVSRSSGFGISIAAAGRDAQGNPIGGTPRNLLSLNTERLVPGAVVMNSQLIDNVGGGISVAGETNAGGVAAPVPYARIVNNTVVGTSGRGGNGNGEVGISVTANASPTLLNNIVTNLGTGLSVDASSATTVVGGMVFHRNTADVAGSAVRGQFSIVADNTKEIFRDVTKGNLYPDSGSIVIDSAIDSLQDRSSLVSVKDSIGIGPSPILAPTYDVSGLLRVDDPTVSSPAGLGENVFKDRGAQDRADFIGPSVQMVQPADNDLGGLDTNPANSVIELTNFSPSYFDIQLFDGLEPSDPFRGTSIDDATVLSGSVLVYEDGIPLVDGIDYRFGYDATSNVIRLTPLAGVFSSSSVYEIRFVNSREFAIATLRGRDYVDGSSFTIRDANNVSTTFEIDTGFLLSVQSSNGTVADVNEGSVLTFDDGVRRLTFELDKDNIVSSANIRVPLTANASPAEVAASIRAALVSAAMQFTIVDIGSGQLQIDGLNVASADMGASGIVLTGKPGVGTEFGIQIPLVAGRPVTFLDGETFTINRTTVPVTFELDTNGVVTAGRVPVRFNAGASAATIGQALVNAIRGSTLGLLPTYVGNGLVVLGADANTVLNLSTTQLLQSGTPGVAAAKAIKISSASTVDQAAIANQITAAINSSNLAGVSATAFGDRIVVSGAVSVSGSQATLIQSISDNAGNALKPNQTNGQTTLTVFLGEGLDYGDAPDPTYATRRDNNGPRHTVVPGFSLGADVRPDADAKLTNADEFDDGVQFTQLVAAFQSSATVTVTVPSGTSAYLSGWIDYNKDGVFSNTERVANALSLTSTSTVLSFLVPSEAVSGTTYARFRLSSDPASIATATGAAPDGEVEDYAVTIVGNPYKNPTNGLDVNGDGKVSPIDALQIINRLNGPLPEDLTLPHTPVAPFFDVNGDGSVTSLDALLVINFLNTVPPGGTGEGEGGEVAAAFGTADVSSGDWMQGLATFAAPAIETKDEDQPEEVTADAFFAEMTDDHFDVPAVVDTTVQRGSATDKVLATMSSSASEMAEEVVTRQAGWMIRQRLASVFRR